MMILHLQEEVGTAENGMDEVMVKDVAFLVKKQVMGISDVLECVIKKYLLIKIL